MQTKTKTPLAIVILMTAFPQLSETIYAPALTSITQAYRVTDGQAQLTMSVYFAAFALGIIVWGRLSDYWGRRPTLFAALGCYAVGAFAALTASDFTWLIIARLILAFGASAGSVVIQTMLRDSYPGSALSTVFSLIGTVLAFSPAIGSSLGTILTMHFGHTGVFAGLCALAIVLLCSMRWVRETRPLATPRQVSIVAVGTQMLRDSHVRATIWQVAGFNIILFGFYTLAPFTFQQLGLPDWVFALSGAVIAVGSLVGAMISRRFAPIFGAHKLIRTAIMASACGALLQLVSIATSGYVCIATMMLAGQFLMAASFGCAIPNLLSRALKDYEHARGTAGALLGLTYYALIAIGLGLISSLYQPNPMYQPAVMLIVGMLLWISSRKLS